MINQIFLIFKEYWEIAEPTLATIWRIFENWWWVLIPFLLLKPLSFLWLWWRQQLWDNEQKSVLLEIKLPKEVFKPIRAMETVMNSLHGATYAALPNWWTKWIDGEFQLSLSFEIVSFGGEAHFFIRTFTQYRNAVESSVYSQYPEAEIFEADDYTKKVPQDIPNKNWDLFGCDYRLAKDNCYPLKTYTKFETEKEPIEEAKIDPVAILLEAMTKIKPGEHIWIQLVTRPLGEKNLEKFQEDGKNFRDKIIGRKKTFKETFIFKTLNTGLKIIGSIVSGIPVAEDKNAKEEAIAPEMRLSPGEKEIVSAIEEKISKLIFKVNIRAVYFGRREIWVKDNFKLIFTFFNSFATANLNAMFPLGDTFTKIKKSLFLPFNLFRDRRLYLRCRRMFRNFQRRVNPLFPVSSNDKGLFILNSEELASIYHFPSEKLAPFTPRIGTKKGEPPLGLPME